MLVIAALVGCGMFRATSGVESPSPSPSPSVLVRSTTARMGEQVQLIGTIEGRETKTVAECVDVRAVHTTAEGVRLEVDAKVPDDAGIEWRAGRCDGDRVAMPLEGPDVGSLLGQVRPGSHLDVLVTIEDGAELRTLHLFQGVPVSTRTELLLSPLEAQKLAHAAAVASLAYTVNPRPGEPDSDWLETVIPEAMRAQFVPSTVSRAADPFLSPGDYVDVLLHCRGTTRPLVQAVFVLTPPIPGKPDTPLGLLVTQHEAEELELARRTCSISVLLRNPEDVDVTSSLEVTNAQRDWAGPGAFAKAAEEPRPRSANVPQGYRGLVFPGADHDVDERVAVVRGDGSTVVDVVVRDRLGPWALVVAPNADAVALAWIAAHEGPLTLAP